VAYHLPGSMERVQSVLGAANIASLPALDKLRGFHSTTYLAERDLRISEQGWMGCPSYVNTSLTRKNLLNAIAVEICILVEEWRKCIGMGNPVWRNPRRAEIVQERVRLTRHKLGKVVYLNPQDKPPYLERIMDSSIDPVYLLRYSNYPAADLKREAASKAEPQRVRIKNGQRAPCFDRYYVQQVLRRPLLQAVRPPAAPAAPAARAAYSAATPAAARAAAGRASYAAAAALGLGAFSPDVGRTSYAAVAAAAPQAAAPAPQTFVERIVAEVRAESAAREARASSSRAQVAAAEASRAVRPAAPPRPAARAGSAAAAHSPPYPGNRNFVEYPGPGQPAPIRRAHDVLALHRLNQVNRTPLRIGGQRRARSPAADSPAPAASRAFHNVVDLVADASAGHHMPLQPLYQEDGDGVLTILDD